MHRRMRQENCHKFQVRLVDMVSSRPVLHIKPVSRLGIMAHALNLSTQEADIGRLLIWRLVWSI